VIFPECALSGYLLPELDERGHFVEPVPVQAISRLAQGCARWQVHRAVGLLEREMDAIFSAAVQVGPEGLIACYRKAHRPRLGACPSICG
jgi:predicted amidohydrolase